MSRSDDWVRFLEGKKLVTGGKVTRGSDDTFGVQAVVALGVKRLYTLKTSITLEGNFLGVHSGDESEYVHLDVVERIELKNPTP